MTIDYKSFYKMYRYNHYQIISGIFKQFWSSKTGYGDLTEILKEQSAFPNPNSISNSIKTGIQQNTFQCIDTLSTFIGCLKPENGINTPIDDLIVEKISEKKFYNNLIQEFAKSVENVIEFFSYPIIWRGEKFTFGEHLFYHAVRFTHEISKDINQSLTAIYRAIHIIAKELSDSRMYNSYKHGLRNIDFMKSFAIGPNTSEGLTFDLSNTITFPHIRKDGEIEFLTETVDTERNFRITTFVSRLLNNIIILRRLVSNSENDEVDIFFWSEEDVSSVFKYNVSKYSFKFNYEK